MNRIGSSHDQTVPLDQQTRLLRGVVDRIMTLGAERAPVIAFDLDGTLVDNRPRTVAIMHDLAGRWERVHPREAEILRSLRYDELDYLLEGNLRERGLTDDALVNDALDHWKAHFFFDDAMKHDLALAGALDFARACHEAGAILVYFTGRDLPNMALGTLASLRDLGFPIGVPGTELVLKPNAEIPDADFKREFTPRIGRRGSLTAAFDNEPANCNIFKELFPSADVFHVRTQHHPEAPPLAADIPVISDFRMQP